MKKRMIVSLFAVLILLLCSASASYAKVSSASINITSRTATSVKGKATIRLDKPADKCTVKLTLQERSRGTWTTAKDVPVTTLTKRWSNKYSVSLPFHFMLKEGKTYRFKLSVTEVRGDKVSVTTQSGQAF